MLKILHRKMLRPLSETEKKDSSFIEKVSNAIVRSTRAHVILKKIVSIIHYRMVISIGFQ